MLESISRVDRIAYNATINVCAADGQWRNLIYFVSEENKGSYIDMCDIV